MRVSGDGQTNHTNASPWLTAKFFLCLVRAQLAGFIQAGYAGFDAGDGELVSFDIKVGDRFGDELGNVSDMQVGSSMTLYSQPRAAYQAASCLVCMYGPWLWG